MPKNSQPPRKKKPQPKPPKPPLKPPLPLPGDDAAKAAAQAAVDAATAAETAAAAEEAAAQSEPDSDPNYGRNEDPMKEPTPEPPSPEVYDEAAALIKDGTNTLGYTVSGMSVHFKLDPAVVEAQLKSRLAAAAVQVEVSGDPGEDKVLVIVPRNFNLHIVQGVPWKKSRPEHNG